LSSSLLQGGTPLLGIDEMYPERNKRAEPPRENLIPQVHHVLLEHELARRRIRWISVPG
jgi:hypothetical protein